MPRPLTTNEREEFLAGLHVGVLSVNDGASGPLSSPVWYCYEPGGVIKFSTRLETRKAALLQLGSRVSFVVQNEGNITQGDLPKYVSVEGPVVKIDDADLVHDLKPIVHRYLGTDIGDAYLQATRGDTADHEVIVHIQPERWLTRDFGG